MNEELTHAQYGNASEEKAIDIMENPTDATDATLQKMRGDTDCLQACRDMMDSAVFLMQRSNNAGLRVEKELERFKKRRRSRRTRSLIRRVTVGIAASVAAILCTCYFIDGYRKNVEKESITVFATDPLPQHITLRISDGEQIVLDASAPPQTIADETKGVESPRGTMHPEIITEKTGERKLDYRNVRTDKTQTHLLTVPCGKCFKVVLCDGTQVWINANSRLAYPTAFTGKERLVMLEGEAYFQVTKDVTHPFVVTTNSVRTRVLGTEFNVCGYSPEDTRITLINGNVEVNNTAGGASLRLHPGEEARLLANGNFLLKKIDTDAYIYWKEGFFYFDNVTLREIMQSLGRWYNVDVTFRNRAAMDYKMHFVSNRTRDLEHIISLLNGMKKATVSIEGKRIIID